MERRPALEALRQREAPLEMSAGEFRAIGHRLVDQIAERLAAVPAGPVMHDESAADVRTALEAERALPGAGTDAARLVTEATALLFDHALFNAHPRFFGYITSSPAPVGMLGDFLASALNQNVGAWRLSPMATEIESQTVRWIAELIGLPAGGGGLLVSGGNMANFVCVAAARAANSPWNVRKEGLTHGRPRLLMYASTETHTWIQKTADLSGLGTDAIRWIPSDDHQRMDVRELRRQLDEDRRQGHHPFLIVGTAGTVSTGAVDPLEDLAEICREQGIWFHVDGAYGAVATQVPGSPASLRALRDADSIAVDPHKWLYAPLEAGCVLIRDAAHLRDAFSYHPDYYQFDADVLNYFDYGPQNSRGFRALKVWLALQQAGRDGYLAMIEADMRLAQHLHRRLADHHEFEVMTCGLSITTFRYVPPDLRPHTGRDAVEQYLDGLNQRLLAAVEQSGEAFLSNAHVAGRFVLRVCIVNFHTSLDDIEALPPLLARLGAAAHAASEAVSPLP